MKRFPAFDPPEYVSFRPDPEVVRAFAKRITADPARAKLIAALGGDELIRLYQGMVRFRLHDITLKRWVKQGVISKAWLGTGEEAVVVGNMHALRHGDQVAPMIRNAGACHEAGMPVADMLKAYLATADQITRGRDVHTGYPDGGVLPPISMVASMAPVLAGAAYAFKLRKEDRVALTWVGDGATRTGEFHEAANFAAVHHLPLILVLQDNRVALGTEYQLHTQAPLIALAKAYGCAGLECDGNHVLDVFAATAQARALCTAGQGPVLLVAHTFRMGGHATHDEAEARSLFPAEAFAHWGQRDPIGVFEAWFESHGGPSRRAAHRKALEDAEAAVQAEIDAAERAALQSRAAAVPAPGRETSDLYAPASLGR
jgi:TPP-dependent pyruvate/acetoin dehydrogenase alpha subunit